MDPLVDAYRQYYKLQVGGQMTVFRGHAGRFQEGAGFGDIFRSIMTNVFPVLMKGAATFLGEAVKSREQGKTYKESAKDAIAPTLSTIMKSGLERYEAQRGSGKRRTHKRKSVYKATKSKRKQSNKRTKFNF